MTLAERLSDQGSAQMIFTLPLPGGEALPDPKRLVQYSDGRLFKLLNISLPLGLERQIAARALFFKPDVIHLHGGWHPVLFFGARVAKRTRIPVVLSLHGSLRPAIIEGDHRLKKRAAWRLYQRRLVDMADVIHVSSEAEREDLARLGYDKPVVVVPNGVEVDSSFVHYCESSLVEKSEVGGRRSEVRGQRPEDGSGSTNELTNSRTNEPTTVSAFSLHPSSFILHPSSFSVDAERTRTVLYLGRLHPLKGLELLIEAWAQVRSSKVLKCESAKVGRTEDGKEFSAFSLQPSNVPPWQLVVAGPDEQGTLARLKAQAEGLGLNVSSQPLTVNSKRSTVNREEIRDGEQEWDGEKRLTAYSSPFTDLLFIGPVYGEEKARVMADADLFVLPTRSENFGLAVAEALARGVPVITTKGAPWSELENCGNALMRECVNEGEGESGNALMRECVNEGEGESGSALMRECFNAQDDNQAITQSGIKEIRPIRAGWWVEIGVEPLVEALREAMSLTDEERHEMGENGRRLVDSKYRWETVAERMAGVYGKFVNAGLR